MFGRKKVDQPAYDEAREPDKDNEPNPAGPGQDASKPQSQQEKRVVGRDDPIVTGGAPQRTKVVEAPASATQDMEANVTDSADGEEQDVDDDSFDRRSGWYAFRKSVREFRDDNGTDLAAGLTYYAVLSIFPAALALLSLLGLVGQGQKSVNAVLDVLRPLVSANTLSNIQGPLIRLSQSDAATATFAVGLVGALWSASSWVRAFSRAMNRIYEVDEGRPFWRLYPMTYLVTVVTVVLSAVALVILGASGAVARSLGSQLGLGKQTVDVWNYAKWPVLIIVVVLIIAILYHFTPNVKLPKFRVLSAGAFVALLVWVLASTGLAFYVANFGSYDRTYGSVAGVVIALLWLWLTHVALVFGAELDSELERARELHKGIEAEETLALPVRSARTTVKAGVRRAKDYDRGRQIREQRVGAGDPGDRPF